MDISATDITKLAPEERLQLIGDLWDSLSAEPTVVHLTDAQKAELDQRLDDLDCGAAKVIAWDEARHRLRDQLK